MISSLQSVGIETRKWYKNPSIWTIIIIIFLVLIVIILTTILLLKKRAEKNNATHIHYTRLNTKIYDGGYELYQLNVLPKRNPKQQYNLLSDFLRRSLFNKTGYEKILPSCPIIYAMSSIDHPEDWRGMLYGTLKYPKNDMPYPYICYLSVMSDDRRHRLGSILLNQFINEIAKNSSHPVKHIQLHTNWENCRAQRLYTRCGFRCNEFTLNGYQKFEPEYKFGHMIRMELNINNIQDIKNVCLTSQAVNISKQDEDNYTKLCTPKGIIPTCGNKNSTIKLV